MEEPAVLKRMGLASRPVDETFETLPEEEQDEWRLFFKRYVRNVMDIQDEKLVDNIGSGLVQLWALAHEYYRLYGPLWK